MLRWPIAAIALLGALTLPRDCLADSRIGNLAVFLNDADVTVQGVVLNALPPPLHESLHSGIPAHVRFVAELWQQRFWRDRRIQARVIERQIRYNVLTKEYRVVSLEGEQREPFMSKQLRDAQRVLSEFRVAKLAPGAELDPSALYYVRTRAAISLGGVNSWFTRMTGDAEETPWVESSLLTSVRSQ